jgi:hypothetical protein
VESDINAFYCQRYIKTTSPYPFIGGEFHYYGHIAKCIGPGVSHLSGPWTQGQQVGQACVETGSFLGGPRPLTPVSVSVGIQTAWRQSD